MNMPNREPDIIFPYINTSFIEVRMWVDEGVVFYVNKNETKHRIEERPISWILGRIERTFMENISLERRRIAADYLMNRALLE